MAKVAPHAATSTVPPPEGNEALEATDSTPAEGLAQLATRWIEPPLEPAATVEAPEAAASMMLPCTHGVTQTKLPGEQHCRAGMVVPVNSTAIAYMVPAT